MEFPLEKKWKKICALAFDFLMLMYQKKTPPQAKDAISLFRILTSESVVFVRLVYFQTYRF